MSGGDPWSAGLAPACKLGLAISAGGVDWLLAQDELPDLEFDASCATAHGVSRTCTWGCGNPCDGWNPAEVGRLVVPAVDQTEKESTAMNTRTDNRIGTRGGAFG
jgi:acetaldehyde dehydrogenase